MALITAHNDSAAVHRHPHSTADGGTGASEPRSGWLPLHEAEHAVQFYESDAFLIRELSEYVGSGLAAGDACVVVATPEHRDGLEQRLQAAGMDLMLARASGQYITLDAAEMLAALMHDGTPVPNRFAVIIGAVVERAAYGGRRVRIFGEMVALLWAEQQYAAALRLEALWNELHATHDFLLFCAYPMHQFGGEAMARPFAEVCAAHRRVIPAESYTALVDPDERLRVIVELQQQARSLESEIAERKRAEREREELLARERAARVEAQAAVQLRDVFLSIAAHELKTPLTALLGNAQLLQRRLARDGNVADGGAKVIGVIADQARRLNKMILGLLDVSRIESGRLNIERAPVDLAALLRRVVDELQPALYERSLVCVTPSHAVVVDGDDVRLDQVVQNLLANAVKYSPLGGAIEVRVEQLERQACLTVTDAGIGIPQHEQAQLFQRYYRASNAQAQQLSGMGIGLYVVNEIVTLHGGSITVTSRQGQGSTFAVYLPLAAAA